MLFSGIYNEIGKWAAIYSYLDIERYFDEIDLYIVTQLKKTFGQRYYKTTKCKKIANKVRNRQYEKGTNSFWRNIDLSRFLPKFIRKKIS